MKKTILFYIFTSIFSCYAFTGKAIKLRGDVFINSSPLTLKTIIKDGDEIFAKGKKSFAQIKMSSGALFLIRDGKLKIIAKDKSDSGINLISGLIYIFFDKSKKTDFKVLTKSGSLGVRGTKFLVMETKEDTYLCVCDGSVSATNSNMSVNVKKGEDIHMTKSNKLKTLEASKRMWKMAQEGFSLMGIPLK